MVNLVFDYDGTIHDPVRIFAPAFRETFGKYIAEHGGSLDDWQDRRIASWFGVSMDIMYAELYQYVEKEKVGELMDAMSVNVRARMFSGERTLYDGAEEMLSELKNSGFHMILFSKCDREHIERQRRALPLDYYFDDIFCTGDFGDMGTDKAVAFPNIKLLFSGSYIIIGDRKQDIDIARSSSLPAIGCAYGYGSEDELIGATAVAEDISDIPRLVNEIICNSGR